MSTSRSPRIVRLNACTMPMGDVEREVLAPLSPQLLEIEGGTDAEVLAAGRDADAIMIIAAYLRTDVVRSLTRCRIISRLGTGVDKIDVAEATRKGIIVNNLPDAFTDEVADHTLALLLAVARKIGSFDREMRQGRRPTDECGMRRLATQTVGIVGFGRSGQATARRRRAFGMRVLACDPSLTPELAAREGVAAVDFAKALAESDYLCLLCPLLPSTRGMLALAQFRTMKPTAVLVNTGRGELVNEDDLVTALREGIIRYAALDVFGAVNVFAVDGFSTAHPLFSLANVLLSPHMAAASVEASFDCRRQCARALLVIDDAACRRTGF